MSDATGIPDPAGFDAWYADMTRSPTQDEIKQRRLGLPPHLLSSSLLPWDGLHEVARELRASAGATIVDLACGRGGYGLELAQRLSLRLIGVDSSEEAIRQARRSADRLGPAAEFRVGHLAATTLPTGSADGVMCIDSIQFAPEPAAAYAELRRIVRPGGRVVLTCWESLDPYDERVGARLRRVALGAGLRGAGFADVSVVERPDWYAVERALWEEAAALDPCDDPALQTLHDEGISVLRRDGLTRRVLATATSTAS